MSDVRDRNSKEAKLARILAREFSRFRLSMLGLIPEDPAMFDVPPEMWEEHGLNLRQGLTPFIESVFNDQAEALLGELSFTGVDWALINEAAADFARRYSYELEVGITDTSRRTLQAAISDYFEQNITKRDLEGRLVNTFGPVRADVIAITETTRASVEGERAVVGELDKQGIEMRPIWATNRDERVCPICAPRDGLEIRPDNETNGEYPPAHARCRCWVNHELRQTA
jgi:hypothetical protein